MSKSGMLFIREGKMRNTSLFFGMVFSVLALVGVVSAQEKSPVVHFNFRGHNVACRKDTGSCTVDGGAISPTPKRHLADRGPLVGGGGTDTSPALPPMPTLPPQSLPRVTITGAVRNWARGGIFCLIVAEKVDEETGELQAFWFHFTYPGDYSLDHTVGIDPKGENFIDVDLSDGTYHFTALSDGNFIAETEVMITGPGVYYLGVMTPEPTGGSIEDFRCGNVSRSGLFSCDFTLTSDRSFNLEFYVARSSSKNVLTYRKAETRKLSGLGRWSDSWSYQLPANTTRGRKIQVWVRAVDPDDPDAVLAEVSTDFLYRR